MNDVVQQANAAVSNEGPPQFQESLSFEPAGFWIRTVALLVDWVVMGLMSFVIQLPLTVVVMRDAVNHPGEINWAYQVLSWVVGTALTALYSGYFYSRKGATPGKMVLGLTVLDNRTGTYLTFWQAVGRDVIGRFLSSILLLVGYIMVAFRSDKRGLHDLLFSSCVVRRRHNYNHVQGQ